MKRVLVTGGAGFIGSHLVDQLMGEGCRVTVVDNFDPFYDIAAKERNVVRHLKTPNYQLIRTDICDFESLKKSLSGEYDVIVHLAAKAGVRPSILAPQSYQAVNVQGTQNLLELAKEWNVKQFVFASSSSVYGVNPNVPWREEDQVLLPISPYAATKVAGELLGHVYRHLYGMRFIGLRFFTVYGPRQRPDLAIHKFAHLMVHGAPIKVYGDGTTMRDYTYIDDIISGIRAAMEYQQSNYEIFNLGNSQTVSLNELIGILEEMLKVRATIERLPEQPGDVPRTYASVEKAVKLLDYKPNTTIRGGIQKFIQWMETETWSKT
ncbi:MAG TPA: NAD-dependent epimerase/dehydratase family protein [Bacillota bacterium]|nr:NAD-dependent epimerase/dehydratase family protein [Bacillota bacterium]